MPKLIKKIFTERNNEIQLFMAENFGFILLPPCPPPQGGGLRVGEGAKPPRLDTPINNEERDSKKVLIIGVFHGDEPEGEFLINKLMLEKLETNNTILFIPCLNPDGKNSKTRTNANGVDLNRNFPTKNWELSAEKDFYYSGNVPASEIETKFVIEIMEEYKPERILTLHTPYRVVNYDGPAKELAENISKLNGYPIEESIGYPTPGSFGTYAGIERNIPTITLELPENEPLGKLWEENREALIYFVKK